MEHSSVHIICAATHCFERSVMDTLVCDNINPLEQVCVRMWWWWWCIICFLQLERSALLAASVVHGCAIRDLVERACLADVNEALLTSA